MNGAGFVVRAPLLDLCQSDCTRQHSADTPYISMESIRLIIEASNTSLIAGLKASIRLRQLFSVGLPATT